MRLHMIVFLGVFFALSTLGCRSDEPKPGDTASLETANPADDQDGDGYPAADDCDDGNAAINPGATEVCDGVDNDCDGEIDEDVTTTWYQDADGDGFGDSDVTADACEKPSGYVPTGNDCDDDEAEAFPGNTEVCDGIDNDCDGEVDEDEDMCEPPKACIACGCRDPCTMGECPAGFTCVDGYCVPE